MLAKEYSDLLQQTVGWRGAYPLVIPIAVGDYFEIGANGLPVGLGNVRQWLDWVEAVTVDEHDIGGSETYYAGCKRDSAAELSGGVTPPTGVGAEVTLVLSFARSAGFVLAHTAGKHFMFRDVAAVKRHVLDWAKRGFWQENWVLVTEVISSRSATLVIAAEANSRFELHANVAFPAGLANVGIADPKLGWTASGWRGSGYSSICKPGTPLYHCVKTKKSMFGKWSADLLDAEAADPTVAFTEDPFDGVDDGPDCGPVGG